MLYFKRFIFQIRWCIDLASLSIYSLKRYNLPLRVKVLCLKSKSLSMSYYFFSGKSTPKSHRALFTRLLISCNTGIHNPKATNCHCHSIQVSHVIQNAMITSNNCQQKTLNVLFCRSSFMFIILLIKNLV